METTELRKPRPYQRQFIRTFVCIDILTFLKSGTMCLFFFFFFFQNVEFPFHVIWKNVNWKSYSVYISISLENPKYPLLIRLQRLNGTLLS